MLVQWHDRSSLFNSSHHVLVGLGIGSTQSTTFVHLALALEAKDIAVAETTWFLCQSANMLVAANIFNMIHNLALTGILKCSLEGVRNKIEVIPHDLVLSLDEI